MTSHVTWCCRKKYRKRILSHVLSIEKTWEKFQFSFFWNGYGFWLWYLSIIVTWQVFLFFFLLARLMSIALKSKNGMAELFKDNDKDALHFHIRILTASHPNLSAHTDNVRKMTLHWFLATLNWGLPPRWWQTCHKIIVWTVFYHSW